jgi:glutamate-1-semialdehyde 2,1-aminomutase
MNASTIAGVRGGHVAQLMAAERELFAERCPAAGAVHGRAERSLLSGVPMNWMTRWASPYPVVVAEASGASVTDIDGNAYIDFCLGDTGAMAGHAPPPAVNAVARQMSQGATFMLPTEDATWVGEELARRFGLPVWQFSMTATDANRFVLRLARQITGRPRVVVHNWCYHGSVDEALAGLDEQGAVVARRGSVGPAVDPAQTTTVVEINDLDALEAALATGEIACVLVEPALTNIGIVLPDPDYHRELRRLTREYGTLLVIDETHTFCAGPGGYTREHGLSPDLLTIGKAIASGVPLAAYGMTTEIAERVLAMTPWRDADVGGVGGTLAGNALAIAAARATLSEVFTDEAFARMMELAERFHAGVERVIAERSLPWHVTRLGCRVEYLFGPDRPRTGAEAAAEDAVEIDEFLHLFMLNRGILLTPFHNMALMSPATTAAQVDTHTELFAGAASALLD